MLDTERERRLRQWQQRREMEMGPNDYQKLAMRTLCDQMAARERIRGQVIDAPKMPTQILHALIGLQGEVGELSSLVQKWLWYGKTMTIEEVCQKIKDETGDVLWYVAELLSAAHLTMEEVMEANIAKLQVRYPDRYEDRLAADEARDRLAEAAAVAKTGGHAVAHAGSAAMGSLVVIEREPVEFTPLMKRDRAEEIRADAAKLASLAGFPEIVGSLPKRDHQWTIIQGVAGSGRKCKLCGMTEGF